MGIHGKQQSRHTRRSFLLIITPDWIAHAPVGCQDDRARDDGVWRRTPRDLTHKAGMGLGHGNNHRRRVCIVDNMSLLPHRGLGVHTTCTLPALCIYICITSLSGSSEACDMGDTTHAVSQEIHESRFCDQSARRDDCSQRYGV